MGRNTNADRKPLLEDAEQNIGNSTNVHPQDGVAGTVLPQEPKKRIINLQGGSAVGQTTSIVVTARRLTGPSTENPYPGMAGPITGVVEFGNGGRSTRAEFDVPVGPFTGNLLAALTTTSPQDGGVIITVPTGVVRLFARYDNLLVAPILNTDPPISLAENLHVAVHGPGGPYVNTPAEPVLVQAMASYFNRHRSPVYKTTYCYVSQGVPPVAVPLLGSQATYCLPPFARTLRIMRQPSTSALDVNLFGTSPLNNVESFSIAANTLSPTIELTGYETIVNIQGHAPADTVTFLAFSCEIGI